MRFCPLASSNASVLTRYLLGRGRARVPHERQVDHSAQLPVEVAGRHRALQSQGGELRHSAVLPFHRGDTACDG